MQPGLGSDLSDEVSEPGSLAHVTTGEESRTMSQIKRSRIDLNKRYVFLCPMRLAMQFDVLPHQAKDMALLVFRCARNHVFDDSASERVERMRAKVDAGRSGQRFGGRRTTALGSGAPARLPLNTCRCNYSEQFLEWVRTKEKEDCVFWYRPDRDLQRLSSFFEDKIDPVREQPYRPLLLDPHWWRVRFDRHRARFVGNPSVICGQIAGHVGADSNGLHSMDITEQVMKELLFQSNPTLEPLSNWLQAPSMRFEPPPPPKAAAGGCAPTEVVDPGAFRGYVALPRPDRRGVPSLREEGARGSLWPQARHDRLDNLHSLWQTEDSVASRHTAAASRGPPSSARSCASGSGASPGPGSWARGCRSRSMQHRRVEPGGKQYCAEGESRPASCTPREGPRPPYAWSAPLRCVTR